MKRQRTQHVRVVVCSVCNRSYDAFRIHKTTCSDKCRKQRSRWLQKVATEMKAKRAAGSKSKKKKKPAVARRASKKK